MKRLKFYDKAKKKFFTTTKYTIKSKRLKNGRMFKYAIATTPSGAKTSTIISTK